MRTFSLIVLFIPGFIFCSCGNKCKDSTIVYGHFELSAEGKSFNPYLPENQTVVFSDGGGNEYRFVILGTDLQTDNSFAPGPCPMDSSQSIPYESSYTFYKIKLSGIEINTEFQIWLIEKTPQPNQNGITGEELYVQTIDNSVNETALYHSINQLDGLGNPINHEAHSEITDSLTILNKTFYQVIRNNKTGFIPNPKYEIYYNKTFGIVGFTDTHISKNYVFERIEN